MTHEEFLKEFLSLPPEGQRQVASFIAILRERYSHLQPDAKAETSNLAQDGFIGMWRDREDMQESGVWVRRLREREWVK